MIQNSELGEQVRKCFWNKLNLPKIKTKKGVLFEGKLYKTQFWKLASGLKAVFSCCQKYGLILCCWGAN